MQGRRRGPSPSAGAPRGSSSVAEGFSLVEVLVAMALTGLLAVAIAPLLIVGVESSAVAEEVTEITVAAVDQMEHLRSLDFADSELAAGGSLETSEEGYSIDPLPGFPDRYVRWEIADVSTTMKQIRVLSGTREPIIGDGDRPTRLETFKMDLD